MLDKDLKMHVKITVDSEKEQMAIGNHIHNQLMGNKDYIDCGIVLNIDAENEINLYIGKEVAYVPPIVI